MLLPLLLLLLLPVLPLLLHLPLLLPGLEVLAGESQALAHGRTTASRGGALAADIGSELAVWNWIFNVILQVAVTGGAIRGPGL